MPQCEGRTAAGSRCRRLITHGSLCTQHALQDIPAQIGWSTIGALAGNVVVPGLSGLLGGAALASLARSLRLVKSRKARVFVSFDFDHDQGLKHLLIGQASHPDAPFDVVDASLKEAAPEKKWKAKARAAISESDLVLVLVGRHTYKAPGVLAEVTMAAELGKPIVQLIGRSSDKHHRVPNAGRLLRWSRPNLTKLFRA